MHNVMFMCASYASVCVWWWWLGGGAFTYMTMKPSIVYQDRKCESTVRKCYTCYYGIPVLSNRTHLGG